MTEPLHPDSPPEQSMEEILASIRQIISEDLASVGAGKEGDAADSPDARVPHAQDEDDDVLILTEPAPSEPSPWAPPREEPADHPAEASPDSPSAAAAESLVAEPTAEAGHGEPDYSDSEPMSGRSLALASSAELPVVAPETAAVVAASFERLTFVVENTPPPPPFAVSPRGTTLEDITREILTPVIKAWLDENLPAIVRARVDEEVERITRGRVR
jgi:cell pole-organizing protein PopZ